MLELKLIHVNKRDHRKLSYKQWEENEKKLNPIASPWFHYIRLHACQMIYYTQIYSFWNNNFLDLVVF